MLTAADRSSVAPGHLVNGTVALPQPVQVSAGGAFAPLGGAASPTVLRSWTTPLAKELVQLQFRQPIAETDRLLVGRVRQARDVHAVGHHALGTRPAPPRDGRGEAGRVPEYRNGGIKKGVRPPT